MWSCLSTDWWVEANELVHLWSQGKGLREIIITAIIIYLVFNKDQHHTRWIGVLKASSFSTVRLTDVKLCLFFPSKTNIRLHWRQYQPAHWTVSLLCQLYHLKWISTAQYNTTIHRLHDPASQIKRLMSEVNELVHLWSQVDRSLQEASKDAWSPRLEI